MLGGRRRSCGGSGLRGGVGGMPQQDGFANAANEYGPEPTKQHASNEAADRRIQKDAIRRTIGRIARRRRQEKAGEPSGEKNEFHERGGIGV